MVSSRPLISKFSSPCTYPLVTAPSAPITSDITVTFIFHSFFSSQARSCYLSLFSLSFNFTLWSAATASIRQVLFFLLTISRSGRLAGIRWSVRISKSQTILCVTFSKTDSGLSICHFFVWSNFNFLHNSLWIIFPTHSYLVLYSYCADLLHSLIKWLIVSSLSPYNLHLLFFCVLSIFALT